ncbi:MAG: excisionase family DNA-binding protein [Sphaerochaeta sp.]
MIHSDENGSSIVFQVRKEHFNYAEAASYLGVSISVLKELVKTETVPFAMVGNTVIFTAKNLDSWVDSLTVEPSSSSPTTDTTDNQKPVKQPPRMMDYKQAAEYLSISVRTLTRQVEDGTIPYLRMRSKVLFDRHIIDNWIEQKMANRALTTNRTSRG